MSFDFKKAYKEFYLPAKTPTIIKIPPLNYIAVRGKGDPNEEEGEYSAALGLLYGIGYTLKMSNKGDHKIEGYFDYSMPPLEGLWWQDGIYGVDYTHKERFQWISIIRLPDFITRADVEWAKDTASKKKKKDFSPVEIFPYTEDVCVQCMHIGCYDDEPATIKLMEQAAKEQGYQIDISEERHHHEIYLSDPRKASADKLKTVIRYPVKKL